MRKFRLTRAMLVSAGILGASQTFAQPLPRPAFDVASVKPVPDCSGRGGGNAPAPGRIDIPCITLRNLIRTAYGSFEGGSIGARQIEAVGGPAWLDSDMFTISAKAAGNAPVAEMAGPMLQSLLEDRFQVKVHREARDKPVYVMTVAKNTAKLHEAKEGSCTPMDLNNLPRTQPAPGDAQPVFCGFGRSSRNSTGMVMDWYGTTMAEVAGRMLSGRVDRPIVDKTGLTGKYDLHLELSIDTLMSGATRVNGGEIASAPPAASDPGASIFTVIQEQLGLKLSPDKIPIDVIVVDRAEKPSQN